MKRLYHILKHEAVTFVRAPLMLILLFICPMVVVGFIPQTLGSANKISCAIVDMDHTSASRDVSQKIISAENCLPPVWCSSVEEAMHLMENNAISMIVSIPHGYEEGIELGNPPKITLLADGSRVIESDISAGQMISLLSVEEIAEDIINLHGLFNTEDHSEHYYLVSLISLALVVIAVFLIGLNITVEKKFNTLSQIIVTGVDMRLYLGIKVFFFSLVVIFELFLCLAVGHLIYDLTITSGPGQLLMVTFILTLPLLFIGVFIASIARTDIQAIYLMIFVLIFMVMLSSIIAPLSNMSGVAHYFCRINPVFWLTKGIRAVITYGFPLRTILPELVAAIILSVIFFFVSIRLLKRID